MTTPSEHCKIVANHALKIFGGNPKVQAYYSDDRSRSIDILTSIDPADNEIESISTIGLSETPLFTQSEEEFFTRIELCAGTMTHEKYWRNAIVSAALHIRQNRQIVMPGDIIQDAFSGYIDDPIMPHIYLAIPFFWNEDHFPELTIPPLMVNWLQCLSIYESERIFIEQFGHEKFESILESQGIDVLNPDRLPAI